ncbi:ketoreductase [Pseudovibrio japonicus]|uniref:Ketoreductase n=1 Tax=Pseudovibrio japonicus TaxID=366534 RepID=A0ABQ3EQL8_9HYPH|nr:SDR family oxidoreductase [Pseudovibrio japonicus]GHB42452.1 ketoreductase [Pseudovibrio japonicus]
MTDETSWEGKVAIVTGGSSGIGAATAKALADKGAIVAITGRNRERLDAVAATHDNILAVQADSADASSAADVIETVVDGSGRLDLLVNNAGAGGILPISDYDEAKISQMCALNIIAPSLMVKEATPALQKSKGAIVNVSTAVSRNAAPALAHYAATKIALEHLTASWAMELAGDGIRVNTVSPGPVKSGALTGMMGLPEEMARAVEEQEASQVPLGRRGVTSDIVPWILRLGNSENDWLTGQIITVDGGWSLRS